jgi:hypothetical protein
MMSFQQFLDEKAKPPGSFTKANSPARLLARGCPRPAGPARPRYTGLSVASVYPVAKMRG